MEARHEVAFGLRPGSARGDVLRADLGADVVITAVHEAIRSSEAVLLAVPGTQLRSLLESIGADLHGKVVFDATNRLTASPFHDITAFRDHAPAASAYRAFNTLGWEVFSDPRFGEAVVDLFFCGPGGPSLMTAEELIRDVGLRPVRIGELDQADVLDGLTRLYFALAVGRGLGRRIAFRLVSENAPTRE